MVGFEEPRRSLVHVLVPLPALIRVYDLNLVLQQWESSDLIAASETFEVSGDVWMLGKGLG